MQTELTEFFNQLDTEEKLEAQIAILSFNISKEIIAGLQIEELACDDYEKVEWVLRVAKTRLELLEWLKKSVAIFKQYSQELEPEKSEELGRGIRLLHKTKPTYTQDV